MQTNASYIQSILKSFSNEQLKKQAFLIRVGLIMETVKFLA